MVSVLGFQGQWSPANLPGNNGNTIITPQACRTAAYTAQSGDVAVIAVAATASPTQPVTDVLYVNAMVAEDGAAQFKLKNSFDAAESLQDGTAHTNLTMRLALVAGKTYVFAAGVASNNAVSISPGYCTGVVTIVRS